MNSPLRKKIPGLKELKKSHLSKSLQEQPNIPLRVMANERYITRVSVKGTHDAALWQTARDVVVSLLRKRTGLKSIQRVRLFTLNAEQTIRCNLNDFRKAVRAVLQALYGLIPQIV